jgi:hypothetical protein
MLVFADQASQTFSRFPARSIIKIAATVAYAGHIYMAYTDGSVFTTGHKEPIIGAGKPGDVTIMAVFLVESAGDLLLVIRRRYIFRVFRIDVERKVLEPVTSIGGRALFLGRRRCLSVAADKFPTVHGDCLYYATPLFHPNSLCSQDQAMYEFSIRGGEETLVSSDINLMSGSGLGERLRAHRPWSIARVFLRYCLNLPDLRARQLIHT